MTSCIRPVSLLLALAAVSLSSPVQAFSFKDVEKLEAAEQQELLDMARRAAQQRNFPQARKFIEQARNKGYNPKSIDAAENIYQREYAAHEDQKRREEAARQASAAQEEALRRQAQRQAQVDSSGNKGGALNCHYVSSDYGLWNYCTSGSCEGLTSNYGLWNLCRTGDASGLSRNYAVWNYIQGGDASGFASNHHAFEGARQNAGSLADRKRYVIYYLRGYVYRNR